MKTSFQPTTESGDEDDDDFDLDLDVNKSGWFESGRLDDALDLDDFRYG
jgi:hypothetical protein